MKARIETFDDGTAILYAETLVVKEDEMEQADTCGVDPPIYWMASAYTISDEPIIRYMVSSYYEGRVIIETGGAMATLRMTFEEFDALYTDYIKSRPRFALRN